MPEMFAVQKGVPRFKIDRRPHAGRRKFPVETMAVDDFFFMPGRATKSVSAYISRTTKGLPGKFTAIHGWAKQTGALNDGTPTWTECMPTDEGATEGTGVWRVE